MLSWRTSHLIKLGCLSACAALVLAACDNDAQDGGSTDDTEAAYPIAIVTVPAMTSVKDDFVEVVQSRVADGEIENAEEAARLGEVLGALETVLQTELATVLNTRDPALAMDMMGWSSALAEELLAVVGTNDALSDRLDDLQGSPELGQGEPSGLADSPGLSRFESSLGGLMDSMSRYMQDAEGDWPGEGPDNDRGTNTESDNDWVNYLNDKVPQGADPDPDDPAVDATGDTWTDYLNNDAAPGADPDRPEEGDSSEDEGTTIEVNDDEVVVVWSDEEGNLDRVETHEDEDGTTGGDEGGTDDDTGMEGDGGDEPDAGDDGDGDTGGDGDGEGDTGDEEIPCDPNIDSCNTGGGDIPDTDPNEGTTQPGPGDADREGPAVDLDPAGAGLGPLILVGPDHQRGGAVVLVVRSPTYGLTQPGPGDARFNGGFWKGDADAIGGRIERLFSDSELLAGAIADICGSGGC